MLSGRRELAPDRSEAGEGNDADLCSTDLASRMHTERVPGGHGVDDG